MRKILSLIMVVAMLMSSVAVMGISAGAEFIYDEEGLDYVEAYYFASKPTIDGVVSEAEWGTYTFELTDDCATVDSQAPYYNSFLYWKAGTPDVDGKVWLRWDENNFYVAAKIRDYDGHSLKHGKTETWNGDALQFRVDPDGPNSITGGDPESYTFADYEGRPWVAGEIIADFVTGYSQIAGGFVECYDNTNDIGLTAYSKPVLGAVDVAIAPSDMNADDPLNYSDDTLNGYTTYELAIPWKYVYENEQSLNPTNTAPYTMTYTEWSLKNQAGGIGRELGMSLTVFNAEKGAATWNSFVSWGSGVTSTQEELAPQTCKGSNSVTLSAEKVTPAASYPTGDVNKLNAVRTAGVYDNVFYDYLGGDLQRKNALSSADGLTTLTYDDAADLDFWGSADLYQGSIIDVGGEHGNVLNYDRMLETKTEEDGTVRTQGVDAIDQFYIDTTYGDKLAWTYPLSYTFEFDYMYTGTEIVQEGRESVAMVLFGGANAVEYQCGYSFNDRQFVISEWGKVNPVKLASYDFELEVNKWYNWKFQYDNDSCTVRLLIDDQVIFNVYNRYFYYSNEQHLNDGTMMIFWMLNTQGKFDNVKTYNFYDYVHKDAVDAEPNGGGNNVQKPTTSTGGADIDVNVQEKEDGTFTIPVLAKPQYKTVTSLSYTFSFDAEKFEFVGVKGLEEADYKVETKEDGTTLLTITNLTKIKAAKTGDQLFELVFKGKAEGVKAADLSVKLADTFKYTVATGDSMLYVAAVAAVVLAGCAVICTKKRRSF